MNKSQVLQLIKDKCCCGGATSEPTPDTGCCYKEITLAQAYILSENESIIPNQMYKITGVHKNKVTSESRPIYVPVLYDDGNNAGVDIFLRGVTKTTFSEEGWGLFWNPLYDKIGYFNYSGGSGKVTLYVSTQGTGYSDGTGIAVTGGTGTGMTVDIITDSGQIIYAFINQYGTGYSQNDNLVVDSGNGDSLLILNIDTLQSMYKIYDGSDNTHIKNRPAGYVPGSVVYWGGYAWTSTTGALGTPVSCTELDPTNWEKLEYGDNYYYLALDYIEYDFENDWISRRKEVDSNVDVVFNFEEWNSAQLNGDPVTITLHAIAVAQWGNKYTTYDGSYFTGLTDIKVDNAYFEFVNFKGEFMRNFNVSGGSYSLDNYRGFQSKFQNITISNRSLQRYCTFDYAATQINIFIDGDSQQLYIDMGEFFYNAAAIQESIEITGESIQSTVIFIYGGSQKYIRLKNTAYQFNIYVGTDSSGGDPAESEQLHIDLEDNSGQTNITLNHNANQNYLRFTSGSYQSDCKVEHGSQQSGLTFDNGSYQYGIELDNNAQQTGLFFQNNSGQYNDLGAGLGIKDWGGQFGLSFINGSLQRQFAFAASSSQNNLNLNGQTIDYNFNTITSGDVAETDTILNSKNLVYTTQVFFDGSAGHGAVGSITMSDFYVPVGYFISQVIATTTGLGFGGGAYIELGLSATDQDAGLDVTTGDCATLSGTPITMIESGALPLTQTGSTDKLSLTVGGANITAGSFKAIVTLTKLSI